MIQTILLSICKIENKIKLTYKEFVFICIIVFIEILSNLLTILLFDNYNLNEILVIVSVTTNIYFLIVCMKHYKIELKELYVFFYKLVKIGIIACIFNLFLNYKQILNLSVLNNSYEAQFSSFFANRNTFGILMLICIISNQYLIEEKYNKKCIIYQLLFVINIILTMARTSILGFVLFYILYLFFSYIKYHKKITKYKFFYLIIAFVVLIACTFKVITTPTLFNKIDTLFLRTNSVKSGTGRTDVWMNGLNICIQYNLLFGVGRYKALELNETIFNSDLPYFHSIYIETLATYGICGLIVLIYGVKNIFKKIRKSEFKYNLITISAMYSFLFISIFESTTRFSIGYADTVSLIYFFSIPILIGNVYDKLKEKGE